MPGFDGSGPSGRGPMTDGARGYCNSGALYGIERSGSRRDVGFGYGRGRGYRHMFWETGLPPLGAQEIRLAGFGPVSRTQLLTGRRSQNTQRGSPSTQR